MKQKSRLALIIGAAWMLKFIMRLVTNDLAHLTKAVVGVKEELGNFREEATELRRSIDKLTGRLGPLG